MKHDFDNLVIPEPNSGCLLWIGNVTSRGYGRVKRGGKVWQAHRFAWVEANGPIPDGVMVCHHCDNPPCVNVGHLFLGSAADNAQDSSRKGRRRHQKRTTCLRGHPLVGTRTDVGTTYRMCRECDVLRRRAALARGLSS
jgi:hypothetical protein